MKRYIVLFFSAAASENIKFVRYKLYAMKPCNLDGSKVTVMQYLEVFSVSSSPLNILGVIDNSLYFFYVKVVTSGNKLLFAPTRKMNLYKVNDNLWLQSISFPQCNISKLLFNAKLMQTYVETNMIALSLIHFYIEFNSLCCMLIHLLYNSLVLRSNGGLKILKV